MERRNNQYYDFYTGSVNQEHIYHQITKARKKRFDFMRSILLQMTRSKKAARKEKKISNYFNAQENQIFYKNIPQIYFPTNFTNGMDVTIDV